jgi:hypothetical protein
LSHPHGPSCGFLFSHRAGGRWTGVLLHRDAFLVYADPSVLREPPGDLAVHVGRATRTIDEILLIDERVPQARSAAMIRLARPVENATTVVIDRAAVARSLRDGRPLWPALQALGIVPGGGGEPGGTTVPAPDRPMVIAVKSVTADPADWCTIFWWMC